MQYASYSREEGDHDSEDPIRASWRVDIGRGRKVGEIGTIDAEKDYGGDELEGAEGCACVCAGEACGVPVLRYGGAFGVGW